MIDLAKQTARICHIWMYTPGQHTLVLKICDRLIDDSRQDKRDIFIVCYGASLIPQVPSWKIGKLRKRRIDHSLTMIWDEDAAVRVHCQMVYARLAMPDPITFLRDGVCGRASDDDMLNAPDDMLTDTQD